jgi:hypothetical protein
LAQLILDKVKEEPVETSEVVFDYSNNPAIISVLKPLVGQKGIMKVSNFTLEALESEDYVIISVFDQMGESILPDIAKKLFSLSATVKTEKINIADNEKKMLKAMEQETINLITTRSAERNSEYFDNEVDKLDKWADDMKTALELDLKKLDIDIKTAKTLAKKNLNLADKLNAQRSIKEMEKRRNEMRKKLYDAQDDVDKRKEELIARVEVQLNQKSYTEPIFIISWHIL